MNVKPGKVAIVGAGFVGSSAAYQIMGDGSATEIVLIDKFETKAEGEAMDLNHGLWFKPHQKIVGGGSYELCKDAELIIITAGANRKPGQTRLDLVKINAAILKEVMEGVLHYNKNALVMVVANPVDIITYLALKQSGFPESRVFGTGTMLDTARFRYFLGEHFGVSPESVNAYILGEHGDSQFPWWSAANIGGAPLNTLKQYNKETMNALFQKTKTVAAEVIAKKQATYYAIGMIIARLTKAVFSDEDHVFPLSTMMHNYYGVSDVCLSVPCVLNRKGVKEQLKIPLTAEEQAQLKHSGEVLKGIIKEINPQGV
jgi:L-lactate dehydrogenase